MTTLHTTTARRPRLISCLVSTIAGLTLGFSALAQNQPSSGSTRIESSPSGPVRVIVGFPGGAVTDAITRTIAQHLSERMGQPFFVDNRPGAATRIAMEALSQAAPDGQTIAVGNAVATTFNIMFEDLEFDPGKKFVPISMLGRSPSFVAVRGDMPVNSFAEFKAFAKGAKLSVGHPGNGTNPHLAGAALARTLDGDIVEVAFRGGVPLATALASGDIDFALVDYQSTRGLVEKGAIKLLAVTEPNRFRQWPDLPTGREAGVPDVIEGLTPWFVLMAPPNTPEPFVNRLNKDVNTILAKPELVTLMASMGLEPQASSAQFAHDYFLAHRDRVTALLDELGISLRN